MHFKPRRQERILGNYFLRLKIIDAEIIYLFSNESWILLVTGDAMWACLEMQQSYSMQMSSEAMQQLPIGSEDIKAHAIYHVIVKCWHNKFLLL